MCIINRIILFFLISVLVNFFVIPVAGLTTKNIYLLKAVGNLKVYSSPYSDEYVVYFHVPVPYQSQVPILLEIDCLRLIDYRFIHMDQQNVICAARVRKHWMTEQINWTAWMLAADNEYANLPVSADIPSSTQLPKEVRPWLASTDCIQHAEPMIQETAVTVRDDAINLQELADAIADYCYDIPWTFNHEPVAFDAHYTLNWGNSCTGHAHLGAALFRANGVPARSILNIPTWYSGYMDMHWVIDYYVPWYGWVMMETAIGTNRYNPRNTVVMFVSHPEDEFPIFGYANGIDGCWHSSDINLNPFEPSWNEAHRSWEYRTLSAAEYDIILAIALTQSVFYHYTHSQGLELTATQQTLFDNAFNYQCQALAALKSNNLFGYLTNMRQALGEYIDLNLSPAETIYKEDFESGPTGWTHGGANDEWELGTPTCGPVGAHSGSQCWGTDLDGDYENGANCWLMSPVIDLRDKVGATLGFAIWNSVEDLNFLLNDYVYVEIKTEDSGFNPFFSKMSGVNDDPEIYATGGWSRVKLDLTDYVGHDVQFRFKFRSSSNVTFPGTYIDDVVITAIPAGSTPPNGDLNGDGAVTVADLVALRLGASEQVLLGQKPCLLPWQGDFNGSRSLDGEDAARFAALLSENTSQ